MVTKEDIIPNTVCAAAGWYKNEKCDGEEDPYSQGKRIGPLQGLCGYGNICYARNTILQRINKGGPIQFGGSEGAAKEGLITTKKINNIFKGGRRRKTRRRRRRKKRTRRQRRRRIGNDKRQLKRLATQYRRFKIAQGDKRFKKPKSLVKCTRVSKGKKTTRIYHRRKCRKNERRLSH